MSNNEQEFFKLTDNSRKHLSITAISNYVNLNNDFTDSELKFIEEHLNRCKICRENLNDIFDQEFDKDNKEYEIDVNMSTRNHLNFIENERNIDGIISKDDDSFYLIFVKLPSYIENKNIRISLQESGLIIRIVSACTNKKYKMYSGENVNLKNNSRVYIEVGKQAKKSISSKNKVSRYWYTLASVLIIAVIYFIAIHQGKTKQTKSAEKVKPDLMVFADSQNVKKGNVQKPDTVKGKDQVIGKTSSALQVKVAPEFKNNSFLEAYVNRSKENGIIIAPVNGDTLSRQITFRWAPLETKIYTISVVNNKNEEMWGKALFDTRVTLMQKLDPGLYYWKITANGKLQTVGKFFVE